MDVQNLYRAFLLHRGKAENALARYIVAAVEAGGIPTVAEYDRARAYAVVCLARDRPGSARIARDRVAAVVPALRQAWAAELKLPVSP